MNGVNNVCGARGGVIRLAHLRRERLARGSVLVLIPLLLLGGGLVALLGQAAPAWAQSVRAVVPACQQSACNGQDPYRSGCAGGAASWRVLDSASLTDPTTGAHMGYVQLWWSDTCQTNWARYACLMEPVSSCPAVYYNLVSADGRQETNTDPGGITKQLSLPQTKAQATVNLHGIPAFYAQTQLW